MANNLLQQIQDSKNLIDILIVWEDFLDNNDLYAFDNWLKGEIVEGPVMKRYWVSATIKYDFYDMPDPRGALRLVNSGAIVKFKEAKQEYYPDPVDVRQGLGPDTGYPEIGKKQKKAWLVTIELPRRFLEDVMDSAALLYDEALSPNELEQITDAMKGINYNTSMGDE